MAKAVIRGRIVDVPDPPARAPKPVPASAYWPAAPTALERDVAQIKQILGLEPTPKGPTHA